VRSRIAGPPQHTTVEWWAARTEVRSLETACLIGPLVCACMGFAHQAMSSHGRGLEIPPALNAQWREMISEAVHIAKMIHQLVNTSTQPVCVHGPAFPTIFTMRALVYVSSIPPQRKALASPGLIKALLHIVEHDNTFGGHSTAAYAAMTAVNLIGREEVNEGGLTLTRQAVDKVIQQFMSYFDLSSRRASYPVVKMLVSAKILAHLIIPDTNKTFVIEHDGALDCLVLGLLLDASDPRRLEEGAVELQWTCAMILQNLALIASGVGILRTHSGTMEGLRELASTDSGAAKSEKARQCAVGAMFELEAEKRRAVLTMGSATAIEHIMLSYNWDHQAVIKRVNASLVRRGYTTWIDVEKMQGSTVEAMADAVEGAAAMCYGVSRAYKESANCRLEAQYAYQREKDMVPLMVEEGYRADGWLGMLLGARLYYVLYGSTVSSEAAFEGKMEELCRELGERGKVGPSTGGSNSQVHNLAGQLCDKSQRSSVLSHCLECAGRAREGRSNARPSRFLDGGYIYPPTRRRVQRGTCAGISAHRRNGGLFGVHDTLTARSSSSGA
jgi:hypothetical protein